MSDRDWTVYIDDDGIARLPGDDFRRLVSLAERGEAVDRSTAERIQKLHRKANDADQRAGAAESSSLRPGGRYDPRAAQALRMEAAGYRAEAMSLAILSL